MTTIRVVFINNKTQRRAICIPKRITGSERDGDRRYTLSVNQIRRVNAKLKNSTSDRLKLASSIRNGVADVWGATCA